MNTREQGQQQPRGFASMERSKQREIASRGGRAAHAHGTAHKFSSDEAREAGRKGGRVVSGDRSYMSQIGRRGGHARHARARAYDSFAPANSTIGEPSALPTGVDEEQSQ